MTKDRVFKKAMRLFASIYASICYRRKLKKKPCDILLLVTWEGEIERAKELITELERERFHILCDIKPSDKKILLNRLLAKTGKTTPFSYRYIDYYAAYIAQRHQPRILLTFMDGSPLSIFLKKEMEKIGGRVINIAHCVLERSEAYRMFDFHYYFVFGQSSVDEALGQKIRYGNTKLVKAGSFLIDKDFSLPPNRESKGLLFFSHPLPKCVKEILLKNFNLLAEWSRHQEKYKLVIKHHPLEDESIIRSIFKGIPNVTFLAKKIKMKDALKDVSLALTCWSTSSIEAALLNRPIVMVDISDTEYLELENYYLPRARTVEEIQDRIERTFERYDEFLKKSKAFVHRHLEYTRNSIPMMTKFIRSIYYESEDFEYIPLEWTKDYFSDRE